MGRRIKTATAALVIDEEDGGGWHPATTAELANLRWGVATHPEQFTLHRLTPPFQRGTAQYTHLLTHKNPIAGAWLEVGLIGEEVTP